MFEIKFKLNCNGKRILLFSKKKKEKRKERILFCFKVFIGNDFYLLMSIRIKNLVINKEVLKLMGLVLN